MRNYKLKKYILIIEYDVNKKKHILTKIKNFMIKNLTKNVRKLNYLIIKITASFIFKKYQEKLNFFC